MTRSVRAAADQHAGPGARKYLARISLPPFNPNYSYFAGLTALPIRVVVPAGRFVRRTLDMESESVSGVCVVGFSGRWLD